MVLWPRVLVLDSIPWFQEMGGSLVGGFGVGGLVAFCLLRCCFFDRNQVTKCHCW